MSELQILDLRPTCPICKSDQFSVDKFEEDMKPPGTPPDVIGISDCRGCGRDFLVRISPELKQLVS